MLRMGGRPTEADAQLRKGREFFSVRPTAPNSYHNCCARGGRGARATGVCEHLGGKNALAQLQNPECVQGLGYASGPSKRTIRTGAQGRHVCAAAAFYGQPLAAFGVYLFLTLPFSYRVLLVGPLVWLGLFLFYPKGHKLNRSLVRRAS